MTELKLRDHQKLHALYERIVGQGEYERITRLMGVYYPGMPEGSLAERIEKWREDGWLVEHAPARVSEYIERADLLMQEITAALEELVWKLQWWDQHEEYGE